MASYVYYAWSHEILGTETTKSVQGKSKTNTCTQIVKYRCKTVFNFIPCKTKTRAITSGQPQKTQMTK